MKEIRILLRRKGVKGGIQGSVCWGGKWMKFSLQQNVKIKIMQITVTKFVKLDEKKAWGRRQYLG